MKGIFKNFIKIISVLSFFISSQSLVAYEKNEIEEELIDEIKKICNQKIDFMLWPIGFEKPTGKVACDILYLLEEEYDPSNRYLFNNALMQNNFEFQKLFEESYSEYLSFNDVNNSFNYDPGVLYRDIFYGENRIKKLGDKYPDNLNFLIDNEYDLEKSIVWLAKNINNISDGLFLLCSKKIQLEILNNKTWEEVALNVLQMKKETQISLLAIVSISNYSQELVELMRAILWTGNNYFFTSTYNHTNVKLNLNGIFIYLAFMRSIQDLQHGIIGIEPITAIKRVIEERRLNPSLKKFDLYFKDAVRYINAYERKNIFLNVVPDNDKESQDIFYLSVISLMMSKNIDFEFFENTDEKSLKLDPLKFEKIKKNALDYIEQEFNITFITNNIILKIKEGASSDIYGPIITKEYGYKILNECDINLNDEGECYRKWINFVNPELHLYDKENLCNINNKNKKVIKKLFQNLIINDDYLKFCPISWLVDKKVVPSDFLEFLSLMQGFNIPYGGKRWSQSPDVISGEISAMVSKFINPADTSFPLPYTTVFSPTYISQKGWSFANKIINNIDPFSYSDDSLVPFDAYSELYSAVGRHIDSLLMSKKNIRAKESYYKFRPDKDIAKIIFNSKIIGINRNVINHHIKSMPSYNWPKTDYGIVLTSFYEGYIEGADLNTTTELLQSKNKNDFIKGIGSILSMGADEKMEACSYDTIRDIVLDDKESKFFRTLYELMDLSVGDFVTYEAGNLDSICRKELARKTVFFAMNTEGINKEKYVSENLNLIYYYFLKNSILPLVKNNGNFSDLRYIDSIMAFSQISASLRRPTGIVVSLVLLRQMYVTMAENFILYDSQTLRTEQKNLENALTSLAIAILEGIDSESTVTKTGLHEYLLITLLSSHQPILSEKSKKRMLGLSPLIKKQNSEALKDFIKTTKLNRAKYYNASDVYSYLANITNFDSSNSGLIRYPFIAAEYLNRINTDNSFLGNAYLNIISNGAVLYAIGVDTKGKFFFATTSNSDQIFLQQIKNSLKSSYKLQDNEIHKLCSSFESFHKNIKSSIDSAETIFVTPSVNLTPIPMELILGFDCDESLSIKPVILVNDYIAANEFLLSYSKKNLPELFFAQANPLKESGFDSFIDFSTLRSSRGESLSKNNIDRLPPLPDAEIEATNAAEVFNDSIVYSGTEASIGLLFDKINQYPEAKEKVILLATHGFTADEDNNGALPSLLTSENGELGVFQSSNISKYNLENTTVVLSACDTAAGFLDSTDKMFTGFVKSFADAGSNLIVSSLWPVDSYSSRRFSEEFFRVWKNKTINDALTESKNIIQDEQLSWPFVFLYP